MVEHLDGNASSGERSMSLSLNDAARKKLGIDTDTFVRGPIDVAVSQGKKNVQHIDADLTKATLSLPWIKWSKGKGIKATASFDLVVSKGVQRLENFQLRGAGFPQTVVLVKSEFSSSTARSYLVCWRYFTPAARHLYHQQTRS